MYEYVDNLELTTQSVPSGMLLSEVVFAGTQREEQLLSCDSLRPIRTYPFILHSLSIQSTDLS